MVSPFALWHLGAISLRWKHWVKLSVQLVMANRHHMTNIGAFG